MHDPEQFQKETIQAITDLQDRSSQTLSRQLALGAMVKALLAQVPQAGLAAVLEEFEAEVDRHAAHLPPKFQRAQYWLERSSAIEALQKQLKQQMAQGTSGTS